MVPVPTAAIVGLEAYSVSVEADISYGLPAFIVVGLPDTAVQEARERVRSAMRRSQLPFPPTKLTANLAPADLRKGGSGYDLPLAIAILAALGHLAPPQDGWPILVGELALDGKLRPVHGALSIAMHAKQVNRDLILPTENANEAGLVEGLKVFAANKLTEVVEHLMGHKVILPFLKADEPVPAHPFSPDFSDIRGQEQAKRAMEIAAAGAHNILLSGPPGSGKTLLARSLPAIMPALTSDESLEVTRVHSVAGLLPRIGYCAIKPFRSPHHTASAAALVGGGTNPRPGEISLAHRGILFLDEFPEFSRLVLDSLRQPLEDGNISVSRAQGTVVFPARFTLVAAMNPCPCGYATDTERACTCTENQVIKYLRRISGPILDRIDLKINVPRVPTEDLSRIEPGESSATVRARVQKARDRQLARSGKTGVCTNAELQSDQIRKHLVQTGDAKSLLRQACDRFHFSARAYFRILRVAQTIADLEDSDQIQVSHLAEALRYRQVTDEGV